MKDEIKKSKAISKCFLKILRNEKKCLEKIALIKFFSTFYLINITGKYRDYNLEKELLKIGKNSLKQINNKEFNIGRSLHIITETYLIGGHTRLLSNWIKFENELNPDVLIVNPEYSEIPKWLVENIEEKNGKLYLIESKKDLLKAQEIVEVIKNYSEIILHIHPNDVTTCLALSSLREDQVVYFVNHSDHTFSLGYNYSNCVLELSEDGKKMGKEKRGIKYSEVLPIPIEEKISFELENNNKNLDQKIVVSMASEYKYSPTPKYNFQEFVDKLLTSNKEITFNLIGPSEKSKIWLNLKSKYKNRLNLLGILPKELVKQELCKASIYIDSFPLGSYTCLLEAINLDIPAVSLKTEIGDLDSLKSIKFESVEIMIEKINEILLNQKSQDLLLIKKRVAEHHYKKGWQKKLNEIRNKTFNEKNILQEDIKYFMTDYEKLFLSVSKKRILKVSYRQLLKLKIRNQIKVLLLHLKKY